MKNVYIGLLSLIIAISVFFLGLIVVWYLVNKEKKLRLLKLTKPCYFCVERIPIEDLFVTPTILLQTNQTSP